VLRARECAPTPSPSIVITFGLIVESIKEFGGMLECLNNFFWCEIFITNTLCFNVYKMYECDKNKMHYCNVKNFQKSNFWEFWAIDRTWPTLDKFYYSQFHKWKKIDTLKAYIKFGTKYFIWHFKKKMKCKIGHGKSEEKGEFWSPWNESLRFKCGTHSCLNLTML
jgi:hypothetical protein